MALTIIEQPANLSLSKNPIWVKTETDAYVVTPMQQGYLHVKFWFSALESLGETIFSWNGKQTAMRWKDTGALKNGYDLPIVGSLDYLDYLKANYLLGSDFIIEQVVISGVTYIKFTGRSTTEAFDLTVTFPDVYVSGRFGTRAWAVPATISNNYATLYDVFIEETQHSGAFKKIYTAQLKPLFKDDAYFTEIDIQEILNAYLQYDIPVFNQDVISLATNCIKKLYLRISEKRNIPTIYLTALETSVKTVLKSGINTRVFSGNKDFLHFFENLTSVPPFSILDWEGTSKTIYHDQEEYVYLITHPVGGQDLFGPGSNATILVQIINQDESYFTAAVLNEGILTEDEATGHSIYIIPMGFVHSGIKAHVGVDTPVDYTVEYNLFLQNSTAMEPQFVRNFKLKYDYHYNRIYFAYSNSLGGFSVFATTGDLEVGLFTNFDQANQLLPNGYTPNDSEIRNFNANHNEVFEVNTGFMDKAEFYKIIDFLSSENKFISIQQPDESGFKGRIAIDVDAGNTKLFTSEDGLYALQFKYKYAQQNKGFNTDKRFK